MNAQALAETRPFVTADHVAEKVSWVAAARGRNRRALGYRRWATESELAGRLGDYRRYRDEAARQQKAAWDALSRARLEASYHG